MTTETGQGVNKPRSTYTGTNEGTNEIINKTHLKQGH